MSGNGPSDPVWVPTHRRAQELCICGRVIWPPFARSLHVDVALGSEVVKTDGFIVKGEELDAALVHGVFERRWRLRKRVALTLQLAKRGDK